MNQKELTKTFMMISNGLKPFGLHDFYKINSALCGLKGYFTTGTSPWLILSQYGRVSQQTRDIEPMLG